MYETSSKNALRFLLLGDTAIRANSKLLMNFGLNSAHGVPDTSEQDKAAKKLIDDKMDERKRLATRDGKPIPGLEATKILGPGSILSDSKWSPLLNDSFILGGINRCQEFHLAFVSENKDKANDGDPGVLKSTAADPKEKWKAYLIGDPTVYWADYNAPRVFARETLGLMFFGYQPVFTDAELAFECVYGSEAVGATFTQYTAKLRELE